MWNAGLDEAQAAIKISRRIIKNLRYADDTTLMAESKEEPLDRSERGEWKSWFKIQQSENKDHGIWSHPFMANRWGYNGNTERLFLHRQWKIVELKFSETFFFFNSLACIHIPTKYQYNSYKNVYIIILERNYNLKVFLLKFLLEKCM